MTSQDELINKIVDLIKELQSASYAAGAQDALRRITSAVQAQLTPTSVSRHPSAHGQDDDANDNDDDIECEQETTRRLPRGIVRKLIVRALTSRPDGLPTNEITNFANNEDERMINANALRTELRRGVVNGRYREEGGRWFLTAAL